MIIFHLSEALKIFRRASLASIIAIISTSIAVLLISLSIVFLFLSDRIELKLKHEIEINVFLKKDITQTERDSLVQDFKANNIIGTAKYISEDDAEAKFMEETGEDFRSVLDINPLPASYVLSFKPEFVSESNIYATFDRYKKFSGVDEVKGDYEIAIGILKFLESGWLVVYLFTALLVIIALYFVISTHKLWMISRAKIFNTMKLVGAKLGTIKMPIVINGIIIGLISGLICATLAYFALEVLSGYYNISELPGNSFIIVSMIIIGILLGLISSLISVRGINLKIGKK